MSELPTFGSCVAQERLSVGPVSELYLAKQLPLERQVWVRSLRENIPTSSPLAKTLKREAEILAQLEHPSVQSLFDFVETKTRVWLVLEAIDGVSLEALLEPTEEAAAPRVLSPAGCIGIGLQVADGLSHIHSRGLLHTALRPEHVLISRNGQIKLTGLEHAETPQQLRDEPQDATDGFERSTHLSPEQILGEPLEIRSDVYSLGSLLHQLLYGFPPSNSPSQRHHKNAIAFAPHDEIPDRLKRIVDHCTQQAAALRFSTALEVREELAALLRPEHRHCPELEVLLELQAQGIQTHAKASLSRGLQGSSLRAKQARQGLRSSVRGMLATCLLLITGGIFLFAQLEPLHSAPETSKGATASSFTRSKASAELLVVAKPWAHVIVDGQLRDTTPFSRPIELSPGVHHVRLEHPAAPSVRRVVDLRPRERSVLSVALAVPSTDTSVDPDAGIPYPSTTRNALQTLDAGRNLQPLR